MSLNVTITAVGGGSITARASSINGTPWLRRFSLLMALAVLVAVVGPVAAPAPATAVGGAAVSPAAKIDPALSRAAGTTASVIVRAVPGLSGTARAAVVAAGGMVVADLPLIDGFEARIPGNALARVAASPAVLVLSDNAEGRFVEFSYDESTTASSFARTSGATAAWSAGALGAGVGVAVIDTGVSPQKDFAGRLIHGPDLSGEGTIFDSYGHGTVMAGIVGGSGADSINRTGGAFTGVAPKANIIAVKAAGRNGVVDVSTMLQAMHWVAAHRTQFNIRVLNLSWGTPATQHHSVDPLNYAVQRLWREGIFVVVAAGNSGPKTSSITKPADDPMVLTVGAYDDKQNTDASDDSLSPWSSRGPTAAGLTKPDVVAPGRLLTAQRGLGSKVEADYPKALISPTYIRGSGTSQAAAVVSGLAALVIGQRPSLTPDQVKGLFRSTAAPLVNVATSEQGAGRVNAAAALTATPPSATQIPTSTGLGSIEQARGGWNVETDCYADGITDIISGEIDVRCEPWDAVAWTTSAWDTTAWMTDPWEVTGWSATQWDGRAWTGGVWVGRAWTGRAWTGRAWTDSSWSGRAWTGSTWTTSGWTTAEYDEWTTAEYEEFLTAWWGSTPPKRFADVEEAAARAVTGARKPTTAGPSAEAPAPRPADQPGAGNRAGNAQVPTAPAADPPEAGVDTTVPAEKPAPQPEPVTLDAQEETAAPPGASEMSTITVLTR